MIVVQEKTGMDAMVWEEKFRRWAIGPLETEAMKCKNAESMVRDAINSYSPLHERDISVFAQGSYRNRTNVRLESDVDICVLCRDAFLQDYSNVHDERDHLPEFPPATYGFAELKRDIENAIVAKFRQPRIKRGSKVIEIKGNSYHAPIDVVPTLEGRLYYKPFLGKLKYHQGTVLKCGKTSNLIWNWPEQHYNNGISKHNLTNKQFKKKVRIMKNICNEMASDNVKSAIKMKSFLIESLIYNCPNDILSNTAHYVAIKEAIYWLYMEIKKERVITMTEVNDIKPLFNNFQPWKLDDVKIFLKETWDYVGFGN